VDTQPTTSPDKPEKNNKLFVIVGVFVVIAAIAFFGGII
jgi:hypothetical protein